MQGPREEAENQVPGGAFLVPLSSINSPTLDRCHKQPKKGRRLKNFQHKSRDFYHDMKGRSTVGMVRGKGYRKWPYDKIE
ncbi:hypothetical protein Tco_1261361 [Tanacetum coccineum]